MKGAVGVVVRASAGLAVLALLFVVFYYVGIGTIAVLGPPAGSEGTSVAVRVFSGFLGSILLAAGIGMGALTSYGIGSLVVETISDRHMMHKAERAKRLQEAREILKAEGLDYTP